MGEHMAGLRRTDALAGPPGEHPRSWLRGHRSSGAPLTVGPAVGRAFRPPLTGAWTGPPPVLPAPGQRSPIDHGGAERPQLREELSPPDPLVGKQAPEAACQLTGTGGPRPPPHNALRSADANQVSPSHAAAPTVPIVMSISIHRRVLVRMAVPIALFTIGPVAASTQAPAAAAGGDATPVPRAVAVPLAHAKTAFANAQHHVASHEFARATKSLRNTRR